MKRLFFSQGVLPMDIDSFASQRDLEMLKKNSKRDHKWRKETVDNLDLCRDFHLVGDYELPQVNAYAGDVPLQLIPYTCRHTATHTSTIHFYLDDYRFASIWPKLRKYTESVARFHSVIAPDFSLYCDCSKVINLQNLYRNRAITAIWQSMGIPVIPSVSWADADSLSYCLDGLPQHSVLSVGSVGVSRSQASIQLWRYAIAQIIERLNPKALIVYGAHIDLDFTTNVPLYYHQDFIHSKLRTYGSTKK